MNGWRKLIALGGLCGSKLLRGELGWLSSLVRLENPCRVRWIRRPRLPFLLLALARGAVRISRGVRVRACGSIGRVAGARLSLSLRGVFDVRRGDLRSFSLGPR